VERFTATKITEITRAPRDPEETMPSAVIGKLNNRLGKKRTHPRKEIDQIEQLKKA